MWTLGFDSTASTVTASLVRDGKLFAVYSCESATSHSTTLLPAVESLLSAAGITVRDLDLICCSAGPGSFTGVRIGVATAKGLATPFSVPCVGVSSLEAMAYLFTEIPSVICPVLGARRGNVYAAVFTSDGHGNIVRLTPDELVSLSDLEGFITGALKDTEHPRRLYFAGDSITEAVAMMTVETTPELSPTPALLSSPNGYGAALCGAKLFENTEDKSMFSPEKLLPIYLRKSQAEREKEEKNNN